MKKRGKKITLFLIDGDANGRIMCELSNWSGKSYKIPRTYIKNSEDREDLSNTGVYILFGKDDAGNNMAYIGEAENIRQRLLQHLSAKDFWNETIVFISKDNNLNKAHIKYLEGRLYDIARDFLYMGIELPYNNSPIVEMGAYSSLITSSIVDTIVIDPKQKRVHLKGYSHPYTHKLIS